MLPYNRDGKISVAAVVKLNLHVGVDILTNLSAQSVHIQEKAGFKILVSQGKPLMSDLYKESSAAVKCIQSWIDDDASSLLPTWKNFLQILRELKFSDVADEIDRYLQSTAQIQQPEQRRDSELCMVE